MFYFYLILAWFVFVVVVSLLFRRVVSLEEEAREAIEKINRDKKGRDYDRDIQDSGRLREGSNDRDP